MVLMVGNAPFDAQCIPTAEALLTVDKYKEFLVMRRALIARRLNAFLGTDKKSL